MRRDMTGLSPLRWTVCFKWRPAWITFIQSTWSTRTSNRRIFWYRRLGPFSSNWARSDSTELCPVRAGYGWLPSYWDPSTRWTPAILKPVVCAPHSQRLSVTCGPWVASSSSSCEKEGTRSERRTSSESSIFSKGILTYWQVTRLLESKPKANWLFCTKELTTPTDHEWKLSLVADMVVKTPEERSQLIEIKKHLEFVASYINDLNESKSSPESLTDDGSSLLHFAAQLRSRTAPSLMAEFLSKSSNVNVPDKHGRTPLDIAAGNRSQWAPLLIRQLRRRGARYSQPLPTPHRQASHVKTDRLALSTLSSSDMKKQVLENVRDVSIKDSEGYEWVWNRGRSYMLPLEGS